MRAGRDMAGDFVDMRLHGLGVDPGRGDRGALPERRTNRAEQIAVLVALVGGLAWPRSLARSLMNDAILLAYAGFVTKPQFDGRGCRHAFEMRLQRVLEIIF